MRIIAVSAVAFLACAGAVSAAPASITVVVGPELQAKAKHDLGVRDIEQLAADLKAQVTRQTAKPGAFDGANILLELADARPNRPTFKQLTDNPGLSYSSFGTGGVRIEGHAVLPGGRVVPLSYDYFETDIRYARLSGTWADADWAIDRFARRVGRGERVAER
jgi:hypothetical protein